MAFKPFFIFLIFQILTVSITDALSQPYHPDDNIVLDCGASGNNTAADGRSWSGDINNKIFPVDHGQNKASITSKPTEVEDVPYGAARLSRSEFTYTIPVTPGPKFIRLYFNATNYQQDFHRSKAFFSVKTGQYTLLNNFSTSLTADFLRQQDMMKEFCVTVEKSILNITFAPTSSISEAFAFINGIQVVSMPANLYYPDPQSENQFQGRKINFMGQHYLHRFSNHTALETAYRINIGGIPVHPVDDTGMFRRWDDEMMYLTEEGVSVLPVNTTAKLQFTAIPAYTAPEDVYKTARSTGSSTQTKGPRDYWGHNLTWNFSIDSGFGYLVRLHFCNIVGETKADGDPFEILIANQMAEKSANIISWTGGKYVPYFRDYLISIYNRDVEKRANLSVVIRSIQYPSRYEYIDTLLAGLDAMLNGIEIFKLNNSDGNLAAPNPDSIPTSIQEQRKAKREQRKAKSKRKIVIGVVSGVTTSLVTVAVLLLLILRRVGRKVKNSGTSDWTILWGLISVSKIKSTKTKDSSLPSESCRYVSLAQIKSATNNFNENFLIGAGGFGNVYKGYIDDGATPVAIKRLKPESSQGAHEFKNEIEMLSNLRHRHVVSLIGYCDDHPEMILVYEYMTRGTLSDHLYKTNNPPLSWKRRLKICIGAALGLHYLHFGAKQRIIHRDVKSANILLDEKWAAKVSDFGLSKVNHMSKSHVSTMVKGSIGYLDPEYYRRQQLTEKSDVYSFGVVLCEVLCGRPPVVPNVERRQMNLAEWFRWCYHEGTVDEIVDPHLMGEISPECLQKYSEIAVNCMLDDGADRPSMKEVAWSLELSMQLQLKSDEPAAEMNGEDGIPVRSLSWDGTSGAVFSEINDLNAR